MIDVVVGDSFVKRASMRFFNLLNEMTLNHKQWASTERETPALVAGMYEVDPLNLIISNVESIALKVHNMHVDHARV